MVPVAGVEPARYRYQRILSPPRLPIPTYRRNRIHDDTHGILRYFTTIHKKSQPFFGSLIDKNPDYYVCEVSSFQLHNAPTFRPQIACFLTFTPDHLDWHGGLQNYFDDKASIFQNHKQPMYAVFSGADETIYRFSKQYSGEKFIYAKELERNCCYIKDGAIFFKRDKERINSNMVV